MWALMPLTLQAQQDTIADQRLQEVVVTAKLPYVEMEPGKTSYRLDESVTQSAGTLYDVLASLPGVVIGTDGTLLLNGQSGVKVWMDGKPSYLSGSQLMNLLRSIPATTADKIDLITQPDARYEAAGSGGLIDIRTRKIKLQGMNLSLNGNFNQGRKRSGYGSFSLNYRQGKVNTYLNYSYYRGQQFIDMETGCLYDGGTDSRYQQSWRDRTNTNQTLRVGCDFRPNERTVWGMAASGNWGKQAEEAGMQTTIRSLQLDGYTHTLSDARWNDWTGGLSLNHRLPEQRGEVDVALDYFRYHRPGDQLIRGFQQDTLNGRMRGDIDLYIGQADWTQTLGERWKWQAGLKSSWVTIDNDAAYYRPVSGGWQREDDRSSRFVYDEQVHGAYLQMGYEHDRWSLSAGVRMEYTRVQGALSGNSAQPDSTFTTHYVDFFPSLALSYRLPEGGAWQLSYARRITRPNYNDMNPFVYIFDAYTRAGGNTRLRPSYADNVEAAYLPTDQLQVVAFCSYTQGAITKTYQDRGNREVYATSTNLSSYVQTGLRLHAANLSIAPGWSTHLSLIGIYNHYRWTESAGTFTNRRLSPLLTCTNRFTLSPSWSGELSLSYTGRMAYGQATVHSFGEVNLGIRHKVCRGKGTLSLFANDLLNTNRQNLHIRLSGEHGWLRECDYKQRVGLSFAYRWQRGKDAKERQRKNSIDETKRVTL